ncbi:hypothetical protein, partial [Rubneribacter badeniensis]|uniref:hypothetical protein n=1 Tax=Rubneribacter badeniensis TaxID=2070688 RepID=UPI003A940E07
MVCDKTNSDGFMRIALIAPVPPPYGGISNWTTIVLREFGRSEDVQVLPINIAPNKRVADGRTLWHRVFDGVVSVLKAFKRLKSKDFRDLDVVRGCGQKVGHSGVRIGVRMYPLETRELAVEAVAAGFSLTEAAELAGC